jgi:acetylornithine deacetylase
MIKTDIFYTKALQWLTGLIAIPSFSREEEGTAGFLSELLQLEGVEWKRLQNNVYACNRFYDSNKPTLLLNSHHDTVRPNKGYTKDPFQPLIEEGKLYGLGSNDAGGSLVSLMAAFLYFYNRQDLPVNLWFAATAEEEISGQGGVELLLPVLGKIDSAIVGEPTQMQMAVAERGLLVVDCVAMGVAGHAARGEGINALYIAMDDIERLRKYKFDKESPLLGPNQITVTVIETANRQHNVVPSECRFVLDIRLHEQTSFEEMLTILSRQLKSRFTPRSLRMRSSSVSMEHPLVQTGIMLEKKYYGSPTTSDVALLPFPALKMGPGDSARSHTADEYIYLKELQDGVDGMILFLEMFMQQAVQKPDRKEV